MTSLLNKVREVLGKNKAGARLTGALRTPTIALSARRGVGQQQDVGTIQRLGTSSSAAQGLQKPLGVFSNPGMSLKRPEIEDAKRVDPL